MVLFGTCFCETGERAQSHFSTVSIKNDATLLNQIYDIYFICTRYLMTYIGESTICWKTDPWAFSGAVHDAGSPLTNCWGFIDGTARLIV